MERTIEQEHPIPQQISSYQFRLVGDMTIKQFFQVAAGSLIAIMAYSSSLPYYIKIPVILFSFLAGIAFAFFPLEDRPLSKWIFLFVKSIYSPTLFLWKHVQNKPSAFKPESEQIQPLPKKLPAKAKEFKPRKLDLEPAPKKETENLDQKEEEFLTTVTKHFETAALTTTPQTKAQQMPVIKQDERKVPSIPKTAKPVVDKHKFEEVTKQKFPTVSTSTGHQITPAQKQANISTQAAQFSESAAPPIPPTKANVVVGQVIDHAGTIIENAILEIKDAEGRSVRALKSNKLGHFMIVTPLIDGKYNILTEKDGHTFDSYSFEAKGEIVPPISIRAKQQSSESQTSDTNIQQQT